MDAVTKQLRSESSLLCNSNFPTKLGGSTEPESILDLGTHIACQPKEFFKSINMKVYLPSRWTSIFSAPSGSCRFDKLNRMVVPTGVEPVFSA